MQLKKGFEIPGNKSGSIKKKKINANKITALER